MNSLLEKGLISEMVCGNNFAYILNDNSQFLSTEYKVLQGQDGNEFIKCMKVLYNGKLQFYYLVDGYKSLSQMISMINAERFMAIVENLFGNIINVKNNGFLSDRNIDISFKRIYIEVNTYKVKLIYLPISSHFFRDESSFENELRSSLVKLITEEVSLSTVQIEQFVSDLSNGMLSLQDLYNRMKESRMSGMYSEKAAERKHFQIISMNTSDKVIFDIAKDNFVIGKNAAMVDGVVSFNKMISRVHCKITKNNSQYYIEDLQSANGTYVNCVRLQVHQIYPIKDGDIIRLANIDFQVVEN